MKISGVIGIILMAAHFCNAALSLEAKQLTFGPQHHFFGYIGHVQNIPWNKSGHEIVALRTGFQDHLPSPTEAAEIVLIDTRGTFSERVVDRTLAWNPQQSTMLYWNPEEPETQFLFNDRDPKTGKIFCALFDISKGKNGKRIREYRLDDTPVGNSGVAQRGGWFAAINYGRLARLRPVTGYPQAFDWTTNQLHPVNDGVFKIDMRTGEKRLLVSFAQLAEKLRPLRPDVDDQALFINHTLNNRASDRIFFFVRGNFDLSNRINQGFVMHADGGELTLMKKHIGGHPEWDFDHHMIGTVNKQQIIYDSENQKIIGEMGRKEIFPQAEGDIALSPDGQWLVNGHREKSTNYYTFFRRKDGAWIRSNGFDVRGWESGDLRCDPAPCWDRNSHQIVFPAIAKDGTRQMFLLRLKE